MTKADQHRKDKYGITPAQFKILMCAQNFGCAICGKPETKNINGKVVELAVDHDHETKRVRGLLCSNCNIALGSFLESKEILKKAILYLDRPVCFVNNAIREQQEIFKSHSLLAALEKK